MCRWLAYSGPPVFLETLVLRPENSLIAQSRRALQSASTTNGDGFGVGWFDSKPMPGLFRDTLPAWNDQNLIAISQQVRSRLFFAHVRASTGTPTLRSNCHPFQHENWLFMHNGMVSDFERVRRDLSMLIDPWLFSCLQGTTDSEVLFYLMLTNGLRDDPAAAIGRTVVQTLDIMRSNGVTGPLRLTMALTDGQAVYALRYASDNQAPTLYYGCGLRTGLAEHTEGVDLSKAVLILSEPLDDDAQRWIAVPESHFLVASQGGVAVTPFRSMPEAAVA